MASKRDEAFERYYESLANTGGIGGRELIHHAWDAGRQYEVDRIDDRGEGDTGTADQESGS
jgi:hypothetical protein